MVTARREHFQYLLEPGLRKIFFDIYKSLPSLVPEIFNIETTDKPYETDVGIGTMGDFPKFEGTIEYDRPYQGYKAIYEFPEYAKGFQIERKLYDDQMYAVIKKQPVGLAISANRRKERDGAAVFNGAFDTLGFDGVPLCHDSHPSKAPDGPPARSNVSTYKLSHASLREATLAMQDTLDDRGGKIPVTPDTILVAPRLEELAWQLVTAEGKLDKTHPGTNPNIHQGKLKVISWAYLEDSNAWFLMDTSYRNMFLNWFDRVPLEFGADENFDTFTAKFRAYMRYNAGWSDWVWIHGSTGTTDHPADVAGE